MLSVRYFQRMARWVSSPVVVFIVALAIRIAVLTQLLPEQADRGFYAKNEPARIAWAVVSGHGFSSPWPNTPLLPTAQQPPVYPYILAGIFKLAGPYSSPSLWIAVLLNALFSALTSVVVLFLGKRVFGSPVGILAAWVWACWLYEAVVSIRLWESSLSTLLLALSLLVLANSVDSLHTLHSILLGVLAGAAALTNTTLLIAFPFFWFWLWFRHRRRGCHHTRQVLLTASVCCLILLPWMVRNYAVFGRVIPVRDNFGMELWIGNHEGVTNLYDFSSDFPLNDPTEYNRLGEIRFMEDKGRAALHFIQAHPQQFLWFCGQRFFFFWTAPHPGLWLPLSLASWAGAALAIAQKGTFALPFAIVLALFPVAYYITHPWSTYRHPVEPVMILLTANSAVSAVKRVAARFSSYSTAGSM